MNRELESPAHVSVIVPLRPNSSHSLFALQMHTEILTTHNAPAALFVLNSGRVVGGWVKEINRWLVVVCGNVKVNDKHKTVYMANQRRIDSRFREPGS